MDWNRITEKMEHRTPGPAVPGRTAAVLALVAGDQLVLEVRSKRLHRQPGEVCLPGGGVEAGETPVQAALRETREELGLDPAQIRIAGPLDFLLHTGGGMLYPVLGYCEADLLEQLSPSPAEVDHAFTVPLDWFRANPPVAYAYRQQNIELDALPPQMAKWLAGYPSPRDGIYWVYEGRLIWGITARIVRQVLEFTAPEE